MLFAHGFFAGPLEAVVTTAAIGLIAKFSPDMLTGMVEKVQPVQKTSAFVRYKGFFITLVVLIALTPLGLIAKETAWGEWGGNELKDKIGYIPEGFAKFSGWWKALMPNYSLRGAGGSGSSVLGYILSAVVGMVLISLVIVVSSKFMLHYKKEDKN
jgi:cobalt/nickel transport system permease protein